MVHVWYVLCMLLYLFYVKHGAKPIFGNKESMECPSTTNLTNVGVCLTTKWPWESTDEELSSDIFLKCSFNFGQDQQPRDSAIDLFAIVFIKRVRYTMAGIAFNSRQFFYCRFQLFIFKKGLKILRGA